MEERMTYGDEYIPTASEQKLLNVLANPEYFALNVTQLCQEAGISRQTYYEAMQKPGFRKFYTDTIREILSSRVGDIVRATYRYAKENPKNHQDRKLLLEMAGLYTEKKISEITGKDGGPVQVENMTAEERQKRIDELLAKREKD